MLMEHASHALTDVLSAHQPLSAMPVSFKLPTTETEHASALPELSSESLQTESDIANNAFNIVTSVLMDLPAKHARTLLFFLLIIPVFVQRTTSSTPRGNVFHARLAVNLVLLTPLVTSAKPH